MASPSSVNGAFPFTGNERIPLDTVLPNGQAPESVGVTSNALLGIGAPFALGNVSAGNLTLNAENGSLQEATLVGNITLTNPTNPVPGQLNQLTLIQDATGSRLLSAVGSQWLFSGASKTLTTTANAIDRISWRYDPTLGKILADLTKAFG